MTDEVKVIHIDHTLIGFHRRKIDTACHQHIPNLPLVGVLPPFTDERIQGGILTTDIFLSVVHNAFLPQ